MNHAKIASDLGAKIAAGEVSKKNRDDPFEMLEAFADRHGQVLFERRRDGGFDVRAGGVAVNDRIIRRAVERRAQIDANDVTAMLGLASVEVAARQKL